MYFSLYKIEYMKQTRRLLNPRPLSWLGLQVWALTAHPLRRNEHIK